MESNPLNRTPELTPNPASDFSSPLSSVIEQPEAFIALRDEVNRRLGAYQPVNAKDNTSRLLQCFLDNLSKPGRSTLMSDITSLDDRDLRLLGLHLTDAILKPMRTIGGKTPASITPHPLPGNSEEAESMMCEMEPSSRKEQKDLKAGCLKRDGGQCQISKLPDEKFLLENPEDSAHGEGSDITETDTECSHILPFYLGNFDENNNRAVEKKYIIWHSLYRYFPEIQGVISSKTINSPENAISLATRLHQLYGSFNFTLGKSDGADNQYRIVHWMRPNIDAVRFYFPKSMMVELSCYDDTPMPSPVLLKVHKRIARILNVSGVAKELDSLAYLSDFDDCHVAPDGSTDLADTIRRRLLILG